MHAGYSVKCGGKDSNALKGQKERSVAQKVSACPVAGATRMLRFREKEQGCLLIQLLVWMLPANFYQDLMCDFPVWFPAALGCSGPIITAHNVDRGKVIQCHCICHFPSHKDKDFLLASKRRMLRPSRYVREKKYVKRFWFRSGKTYETSINLV